MLLPYTKTFIKQALLSWELFTILVQIILFYHILYSDVQSPTVYMYFQSITFLYTEIILYHIVQY